MRPSGLSLAVLVVFFLVTPRRLVQDKVQVSTHSLTNYDLAGLSSLSAFGNVCTSTADVTVKGKLKEVDGQKVIEASEINLAKK